MRIPSLPPTPSPPHPAPSTPSSTPSSPESATTEPALSSLARYPVVPADFLIHPYPVLAAALILFNNLYLKRHHPGFLSGKLSDIGICFLLPLILVALIEWATWLCCRCLGRLWTPTRSRLRLFACLVSALYFSALQLSDVWAAWHILFVQTLLPRIRAGVTPDPTDLFALVMIPVAWRYLAACRKP